LTKLFAWIGDLKDENNILLKEIIPKLSIDALYQLKILKTYEKPNFKTIK